jgi:hypothetical protein
MPSAIASALRASKGPRACATVPDVVLFIVTFSVRVKPPLSGERTVAIAQVRPTGAQRAVDARHVTSME